MKIYKQEITDGIQEKILSTACIAYCSQLESNHNEQLCKAIDLAFATGKSLKDGLYPTKSILVSTVWNLNDDVFDKEEAWLAKYTPVDKPTNVDHDEKKMVGHMTQSWAFTDDGKLIDPNTPVDDLPDLYHIVNAAVIYTTWQDPELIERTSKLIAEIEAGQKFVSMECMFHGFDYAVISPDKAYHVIARSSETAFLTKHLRAYGGSGEYEGHRVGRLLRNIVFSGKGYVDKPANPASIILKGEEFSFSMMRQNTTIFNNGGVSTFSISEKKDMDLEKQVSELNTKLSSLNDELKASISKVSGLEKSLSDSNAALTIATEEVKTLKVQVEAAATQLTEATKKNTDLSTELGTIKAEALKVSRVSKLVSGGINKEEAEKKVNTFAALSNDQFDVVAEALISAVKPATPVVEADIDADPAEGNAGATIVPDKTKADPKLSLDSVNEDKAKVVRANVAKWLENEIKVPTKE